MAAAAAARAGAAKAKANEALNPSADKKKTDAQIMEEELEKKLNESRDFYLDEEQWNTAPAKKYIKFAQACGQFTRPDGMYESYFSNFIIGCVHREDSSVTRHDAERGPPSTFRVHCVGCGALAIPTHRSARACATSARDVCWCCVRERERRLPARRPGPAGVNAQEPRQRRHAGPQPTDAAPCQRRGGACHPPSHACCVGPNLLSLRGAGGWRLQSVASCPANRL